MDDAEIESSNLTASFWIRRDGLEPIGTDGVGRSDGATTAFRTPRWTSFVERTSLSSRIDHAVPEPIGFPGLGVLMLENSVGGVGLLEDGHSWSPWIESSTSWCLL